MDWFSREPAKTQSVPINVSLTNVSANGDKMGKNSYTKVISFRRLMN